MDAELRAQFKHIAERLEELSEASSKSPPDMVGLHTELREFEHSRPEYDFRKEVNDRFREQSQMYEALQNFQRIQVKQISRLENMQIHLLGQTATFSEELAGVKVHINNNRDERINLDNQEINRLQCLEQTIASMQSLFETHKRDVESINRKVGILTSGLSTSDKESLASTTYTAISEGVLLKRDSKASMSLDNTQLQTQAAVPQMLPIKLLSVDTKRTTAGNDNVYNPPASTREQNQDLRNLTNPIQTSPQKQPYDSHWLGEGATGLEMPFPTLGTTLSGEIFSTGLEKSTFAPPEVRALFRATNTSLKLQQRFNATPILRPELSENDPGIDIRQSSAPVTVRLPEGTRQLNLGSIVSHEPSAVPTNDISKQCSSPTKPIDHPKGIAGFENSDHSGARISPQKSFASPKLKLYGNLIDGSEAKVEPSNRVEGRKVIGYPTAQDDLPWRHQIAFTDSSANGKSQTAAVVAPQLSKPSRNEHVKTQPPSSPSKHMKQDFLAQMMAGLQDFQKKQSTLTSSKISSTPVPTPGVNTMIHGAPHGELNAPASTESSTVAPTSKICLESLEKSMVRVKKILQTTPSSSLVMNIPQFALGLFMPEGESGGKIHVKLNTIDLRRSGETELSLQIRCDDMKTVCLVFRSQCFLIDPALQNVAVVKISRAHGSTSPLSKRQHGVTAGDGPMIYGIEYTAQPYDSSVIVSPRPTGAETVDCTRESTLQISQLWNAFKDPGAKKLAVRFSGDETEAAATWHQVETLLKKLDERICQIERHLWVKKLAPRNGKAYWKLEGLPRLYQQATSRATGVPVQQRLTS